MGAPVRLARSSALAGGLRLYSLSDLDRVRVMQQHLADGLAAAEAAAAAAVRAPGEGTRATGNAHGSSMAAVDELAAALDGFDEARAQAIFDRLLAGITSTIPSPRSSCPTCATSEPGGSVARSRSRRSTSHPTSSTRAAARDRAGLGRGVRSSRALGCIPGEQHELGPIAFGLALRTHGWRIEYLGADTPLDTIRDVAHTLDVDLVVVSAVRRAGVGELVPGCDRSRTPGGSRSAARGPTVWKRLHSMPSR